MISVIGLGYIGLPTALMLSSKGFDVTGVDYNEELIESLLNNKLTFSEKGLNDLFEKSIENGIIFSKNYIKSKVYIVSVPTPYIKENKKIDPSYIISSINSILSICDKGSIICIESTVSPGTIDKFIRPEIESKGFIIGKDIHLVHTPERIIPGNMIYELENNARTIGCDDIEIGEYIKNIYSKFCKGNIIITDIRSAEMSKVVENTFRDINIAFANELAKICRSDNMDVYEIIRIANMHPRVNILQPGPGVGGHCISVDPWFLVGDYPKEANLIKKAREINDSMPKFVLNRINEIMKENNMDDLSRVGLYGLTYKEDIDDIRESPSVQLMELLNSNLITQNIKSYDPMLSEIIFEGQYINFEEFLDDIDMVVIMVSHKHIIENGDKLNNKLILDTKNMSNLKKSYKL